MEFAFIEQNLRTAGGFSVSTMLVPNSHDKTVIDLHLGTCVIAGENPLLEC